MDSLDKRKNDKYEKAHAKMINVLQGAAMLAIIQVVAITVVVLLAG